MKRGVLLVLFGMLLGGGTVFAAFRWHFVRADDGWHIVTNRHSSLGDCYADVRDWTATEWTDHPQLATALVDAGKARPAFQRMMQKQGIAWPKQWPEPKA